MTSLQGFVSLNGHLVAAAKARVSAFDRGFLYGDGLFETARAYSGRVFALTEHLQRLETSCRFLGILLPDIDWEARIGGVLRRNRLLRADAAVRLTVTRGPAQPGLLPPAAASPTVLVSAARIGDEIERMQRRGARAVVLPFGRSGFLAEHKTLDYLPGVLGKVIASRHRAVEGLYVTPDGHISEGTTSSLFIVSGGRLLTPPASGILPGVTRRFILAVAPHVGLRVEQRPLRLKRLRDADEAFLTSSVVEVLPLTRVDERPIGTGRVGPAARCLQRAYRQLVNAQICFSVRF